MKKIKFYHITLIILILVLCYIGYDYYKYVQTSYANIYITLNTNEYTKDGVIATINVKENVAKEYSFDNGKTWQTSNTHTFYENGNIEYYVKFKNNRISNRYIYPISNIDKAGPTINFENNYKILLNASFDPLENVSANDEGSGMADNYTIKVEPTTIDTSVLGAQTLTYTTEDKLGNITTITRTIVVVEEILNNDEPNQTTKPITQYRYRTKISEEYDCPYECEKKENQNPSFIFKSDSPCCLVNGQNNCTSENMPNYSVIGDKCLKLNNSIITENEQCPSGYYKYDNGCYELVDKKINICPNGYVLKDSTCEKTIKTTCDKKCTREVWSAWSTWSNTPVASNTNTEIETRNIGE